MSIEDRITEILRPRITEMLAAITAGAEVDQLDVGPALLHAADEAAAGLARVLVTELALTEEQAIDKPGHRGINPQRRYVTPWENA